MKFPISVLALLPALLLLPVMMAYRIYPIEGTPYWLFGIVFFLIACNIGVSFYHDCIKPIQDIKKISIFLSLLIICIVFGGVMVTSISDRHKVAPVWGVHDIILQQESAMRYLLQGKNPYKETYFGTPVESFHYDENGKPAVNPALYHFVMPPWYLIFPFSIYVPANKLFGYFDGRMVTIVLLVVLFPLLVRWYRDWRLAFITFILIALSPGWIEYLIEGRSDFFALFWLLLSLLALEKKKLFFASFVFGLALLSKQTIWFALPLWIIAIYTETKRSLSHTLKLNFVTLIVVCGLVGPFIMWDAGAIIESTVLYLSSGGPTGYPVSGYGLGMILVSMSVITDLHGYYPFYIWQAFLAIPTLGILVKKSMGKFRVSTFILGFTILLSLVWYTSRYFNNSHAVFLCILAATGVIKRFDEEQGVTHAK